MQASTWPAAAKPSPVIPVSLQRELKMPHASAEREWMFASGLMQRYVSSATEVHASYVRSVDGIPELPSPLLEGFLWQQVEDEPHRCDPLWLRQREELAMESVLADAAPTVQHAELPMLRGGSGLLEDQSHCPFRAFAKRRLNTQPLGEFYTGMSPALRGSILHDALFTFWGLVQNTVELQRLAPADLEQTISDAIEDALGAVPSRQRLAFGNAYLSLEGQRLQRLFREWIAVEKQRSHFSVYARELDVTLEIAPLEIALRVDRIDQLKDGSLMIIDYKSGRSDVKDWLGARPSKPQLLLYSVAAENDPTTPDVSVLAFAQVRARDCSYRGAGSINAAEGVRTDIEKLVEGKNPAADWQSLNDNWRHILEGLVAEFIAGEAQVAPLSSSSCSYCGLDALCRVGLDEALNQ